MRIPRSLPACLLILPLCFAFIHPPCAAASRSLGYIGTYTGAKSKGIYSCELDSSTGELKVLGLAAELKSPSFVAIHPKGKFLYAISEIDDFGGKKAGGVSAFSIEPKTGKLTFLNQQSSGGTGP